MDGLTGSFILNTVLMANALPAGDQHDSRSLPMFALTMAAYIYVLHMLGHKYMDRCIVKEIITALGESGVVDVEVITIIDDDDPHNN